MSDARSREPAEAPTSDDELLSQQRAELLQRLQDWLEIPLLVLAFGWLGLLVLELIWGERQLFQVIGLTIWVIFLLDFAVQMILAPHKVEHLKRNWLTVISLVAPALRVFRIFRLFRMLRLARAGRGLRLIRVITAMNRGMRALSASLSRRGFGYVAALTSLVTLLGAAGMYAFENEAKGGPHSYGEALWWTAMIMTTMGSQYWPQTVEGRILCVLLALYAFAVFGYVTATLATFFIGRDAENVEAELAGAHQLASLQNEVRLLREDLRALSQQPPRHQ
jgi:voltage-gated potassium channel